MVMDGISQIDANGTDEDNNKYDNMLKNFLGHIFWKIIVFYNQID